MNEKTSPPAPAMYPRLLRRIRAVLIDEVILLTALAAWWLSIAIADGVHLSLKIGSLLLVFFFLDPMLVTWSGGTIGHRLMGLRVRGVQRDQNLSLPRATVRAVLRYLLGTPSLVFILVTRRHQAIHDHLSGSIVVLRNPEGFASTERFAERAGHSF